MKNNIKDESEDRVFKIAIVGGGANGVSVLNELINQLSKTNPFRSFQVALYEKSGIFGAGLAYGTCLDAHILNMPACRMSAVGDEPAHFLKWLHKAYYSKSNADFTSKTKPGDYIPRRVFGMYLREIYEDSLHKAKAKGIEIDVYVEEVTDIKERNDQVEIVSTNQTRLFDQAILCLGNHTPTFGSELKGKEGYFHHAWPEKTIMENIPDDETVYVLGSSLTAVDTFITLQEKAHQGSITFFSRHGLLPKVRILNAPYKLVYLNPKNITELSDNGQKSLKLETVANLFKKEFENARVQIPRLSEILSLPQIPPVDVLKHDIELAERKSLRYFSILKAIDEVVGLIWSVLSDADKLRFDLQYRPFWNAFDYPMPLQNARKILEAMNSGQLRVISGFNGIEFCSKKRIFRLTTKELSNGASPRIHEAKYVINATGQGLELKNLNSKLIQNALKSGTISVHPFGGIDVDFNTGAVKNASGNYSNHVYAVGSLTRGVHFYTNSINENAKCGKRSVTEVIKKALMSSRSESLL